MSSNYQERQKLRDKERRERLRKSDDHRHQRQRVLDIERRHRLLRQYNRLDRLDRESFERKELINNARLRKLNAETKLVNKKIELLHVCIEKVKENKVKLQKKENKK